MSLKINILVLIFYLENVQMSDNVSEEYRRLICDEIKHGMSSNYFTDEFGSTTWDIIKSCPINVCAKNPCGQILNAHNNSCTNHSDALFKSDFECKCLKNSFWSKTQRKCIIDDPCLGEAKCGGPIRAEKCEFSPLNGHVKCTCKPEWMGENCQTERNACIHNYFEKLKSGYRSCAPNGRCEGSFFKSISNLNAD